MRQLSGGNRCTPTLVKMLSNSLFFIFLCFYLSSAAQPQTAPAGLTTDPTCEEQPDSFFPERLKARCTQVYAADRIEVEGRRGGKMKVAYLGLEVSDVDDPDEKLQQLARRARNFNRELVMDKSLMLEFESPDPGPDGRLQAYVFVDKTFVNAELVRQGLARVKESGPEFQLKSFFLKKQKLAQAEKLGLWALETTPLQKPADIGASELSLPQKYVASQRSKVFHRPDCVWAKKIAPHNLVEFSSRAKAIASGRRPCKACKP